MPDAGGDGDAGRDAPAHAGHPHGVIDGVGLGHVAGDVVGTGDVPGHGRGALGPVGVGQRGADARPAADHQRERSGFVAHVRSLRLRPGQTVPGRRCQTLGLGSLARRHQWRRWTTLRWRRRDVDATRARGRDGRGRPACRTGGSPSSVREPVASDWPSGSPNPTGGTSCSSRPPTAWAAPGGATRTPARRATCPRTSTRTPSRASRTGPRPTPSSPRSCATSRTAPSASASPRHVRPHTRITSARWDEGALRWRLTDAAGCAYEADVLVSAVGTFATPSFPDITGLDSFAGPCFHSARWEHEHDLTGRRVAVIGTGASAAQIVPELAKVAQDGPRLPAHAAVDPAPLGQAVHRGAEAPVRPQPHRGAAPPPRALLGLREHHRLPPRRTGRRPAQGTGAQPHRPPDQGRRAAGKADARLPVRV